MFINKNIRKILFFLIWILANQANAKGQSLTPILKLYSIPDTIQISSVTVISKSKSIVQKFKFFQTDSNSWIYVFDANNSSNRFYFDSAKVVAIDRDSLFKLLEEFEFKGRSHVNEENCSSYSKYSISTNKYFYDFYDYTCSFIEFNKCKIAIFGNKKTNEINQRITKFK